MAALCMPTTTNTGAMFTQEAKGDVSVAAINSGGSTTHFFQQN
jgi:predicted Na+-dependent transporter